MTAKRISAAALAFLDENSAPLTVRQLERTLRDYGISKSQSAVLAGALWRLNIIAVPSKELDQ